MTQRQLQRLARYLFGVLTFSQTTASAPGLRACLVVALTP